MEITKKERDGKESVIVVLCGTKVSSEKSGFAPLRFSLRGVVRRSDEVLVLIIVNSSEADASPPSNGAGGGGCCMGDVRFEQSCEGDSYIDFLHEEIDRKEAYRQIFRPYYDRCKSIGVKFQMKIAAGFQPQALVEKANNVDATWIVMDSCFAREQSFQMNGTHCNVALVSGDEDIVAHKNLPFHGAKTSVVQELNPNPKSSKPDKRFVLPEKSIFYSSTISQMKYGHFFPSLASMSIKGESSNKSNRNSPRKVELPGNGTVSDDDDNSITSTGFSKVNLVARMPLQLSWAEVEEITGGFTRMTCMDENANFKLYCGNLSDHHSRVLVKRFTGQFDYNVEAENKAALTLHHKNIMGLIGYHKSKNATVLVYPFTRRWILDTFLRGSKGKQVKLTFQEKMKIAMGIGQGVRYMHEGCPRGPIVHGNLRPCNIFLNFDLEPLITGFGQSTWLHLKQALPISSNRFWHKDPSDLQSLALVKSDIFHFGILLLRLFCRISAPKDDKNFINWARPLLLQGAYHELLDENLEYMDMYGILRVMCAAAQCIKTKPASRPSISEVISILQGETSCAVEFSPLSDDSPNWT